MGDRAKSVLMCGGRLLEPLTSFLGFAFLSAWTQLIYSSDFSSALGLQAGLIQTIHLTDSLVVMLCAVLIAIVSKKIGSALGHIEPIYIAGFIGTLASLGYCLSGQNVLPAGGFAVCSVLASISSVWLLIAWYERIARLDVKGALICFAIVSVISGLIHFAVMLLPSLPEACATASLPLLAALTLRKPPNSAGSASSVRGLAACPDKKEQIRVLPIALLVGLALTNYSFGVLQTLSLAAVDPQSLVQSFEAILIHTVTVLLAIVLVSVSYNRNAKLAFNLASIFIFVSAALMMGGNRQLLNVLPSIARIGSEFVSFLTFALIVRAILDKRAQALFSLALFVAFTYAGNAIGQVVTLFFSSDYQVLSLSVMGALVLAMMVVLTSPNPLERQETTTSGEKTA